MMKFAILFSSLTVLFSLAQAQTSKLVGDIAVMSNSVDKGITQSNKNPAINAGFGYLFANQGKIALDAGSVKFPTDGANVRLGLYGEYKFIFSPSADLKIRNDWIRYFSDGARNKTVISLDQNFSNWHVIALREDNFEGTKSARNWFALNKDWPMGSLQLNTTVGYSQVPSPYDNYFDTRVGLTYPTTNLAVSFFNTWVSKASQFAGLADTAFFLVIKVNF